MSAIGSYQNCLPQSMFRHCKTTAKLVTNGKKVVFITHLPNVTQPALSANARAITTTNKDAVDSHQLDAIFQRKRYLRSKIRKELKNMDPIQRCQEDNAIQNIVMKSPWFKASNSLCAYISCEALREVDTSKIVSEILSNPTNEGNAQFRKKLYVPRVEDKNSNMRMLEIASVNDLKANLMNILEPPLVESDGNQCEDDDKGFGSLVSLVYKYECCLEDSKFSGYSIKDLLGAAMQASEPLDLVILPGLAFDKSGGRLGRGGGYYDMFLKKYRKLAQERKWKQPLLVALAYSVQIMEERSIPVTPYDVSVDALVSPSGFIPISSVALGKCD